jgi:outer membrane protein OmpA-like peptidoglycan-associated protein
LIFVNLIVLSAFGQKNTEFDKTTISSSKDLKTAKKNIHQGDRDFKNTLYNYSLKHYLVANKINPNNSQLNYKIGFSFFKMNENLDASNFFSKAYSLNNKISPDIHLLRGYAYHYSCNFDSAIIEYQNYKNTLTTSFNPNSKTIDTHRFTESIVNTGQSRSVNFNHDSIFDGMKNYRYDNDLLKADTNPINYFVSEKSILVDRKIEECNFGRELIKSPIEVNIKSISDSINTSDPEYGSYFAPDGSAIYFTSLRKNSLGGLKRFWDGNFYEDVYLSKLVGGHWQSPQNLKEVNSRSNDAATGLSPDGTTLYIFKDLNGGDIYFSKFDKEHWTKPKPMPEPINSKFYESNASTTLDGKTIYFISDQPDGNLGGKDIYMSTLKEDGKWDTPKNLGPKVNTRFDEICVFVTPDGNTIYFSSKGLNSMGGFDIFKTEKDKNGAWIDPVNLGYPINTPGDDVFFITLGKKAYYSTLSKGSSNNYNIMQVDFIEKKPVLVVEKPDTSNYNIKTKTNNYGVNTNLVSYLFNTSDIGLSDDSTNADANSKAIREIKTNFIIEFDFAKHILNSPAYASLDSMASFLKQTKKYRLSVSGHADNIGSQADNQVLSVKRAQTVANYIINKGVEPTKIEVKGFSFLYPIASNLTPEGRAKNRRVEFVFYKLK